MTTKTPTVQTLTLAGERFVILPEAQYREMVEETWEPPLPQPDAAGNYPAVEAARVLLARKIIRARRALGLTQVDLAKRAGVRVETISRLEHAKHSAGIPTVDKIDRALKAAEAERAATKSPARRPRRKARNRN